MPLKVNPTSTIKLRLGINPNGKVQKFFTNTCYKRMDKYVPMDKGDLRTIVTLGDDTITYEMKYAKYQYKGMREDGSRVIKRHTTPGTGPYWDKRMVSAEMPQIIEEVQKYVGGRK